MKDLDIQNCVLQRDRVLQRRIQERLNLVVQIETEDRARQEKLKVPCLEVSLEVVKVVEVEVLHVKFLPKFCPISSVVFPEQFD